MVLEWVNALAICTALLSGGPRQDANETRVALKYTGVEKMIAALGGTAGFKLNSLPSGVTALKPDPAHNELVVTGTPQGVKELQEIVRLLDVNPKRLRIKAQLFRVQDRSGRKVNDLLSEMVAVTPNNSPLSMSVGDETWDQTVSVLPRVNGDGSISMRADFAFAAGVDVKKRPESYVRRIAVGSPFSVIYSDETRVRADDGAGGEVRVGGIGHPQYRLEVHVLEILPDPVAKAK